MKKRRFESEAFRCAWLIAFLRRCMMFADLFDLPNETRLYYYHEFVKAKNHEENLRLAKKRIPRIKKL